VEPFIRFSGKAASLLLANVDTDQIAPARFLKTASRRGLGRYLFYNLRFDEAGAPRRDSVLDPVAFEGASILIAGDNFGCGSSREHAPWALRDYGIKCVIAPSFADIFAANAALNGLLLVSLPQASVERLAQQAHQSAKPFAIDLGAQTVVAPSGETFEFQIDEVRKRRLLEGLDLIEETLRHACDIDAFEKRRAVREKHGARAVSAV
jgi:3-isopropylmalate dehydratase small subunit